LHSFRDPTKRLGYNGAQEIRERPFYATIDWDALLRKEVRVEGGRKRG
jgi:hypothetical protein